MGERDDDELVTVFKTADPAVLPVVESLFEASGLPYIIQGNQAFHLYPLGVAGPMSRHGLAVRFLVPPEFVDEARELLTEVGEDLPGGAPEGTWSEEGSEDEEWSEDDEDGGWSDDDAGSEDDDGDWSDDGWDGDSDLDDDY